MIKHTLRLHGSGNMCTMIRKLVRTADIVRLSNRALVKNDVKRGDRVVDVQAVSTIRPSAVKSRLASWRIRCK